MMQLFYLHHRWLAYYRKGELYKLVAIIFLLSMFVFRLGKELFSQLGTWTSALSTFHDLSEPEAFQLLLVLFVFLMTAIKIMLSHAPLHYEPYRLWPIHKTSLAIQYVILSHLKPSNFFWLLVEIVMLIKAGEMGINALPLLAAAWLIQHYLNIILHPYNRFKWSISLLFMLLAGVTFLSWFGFAWVGSFLHMAPLLWVAAILSLIGAITLVSKQPEAFMNKTKMSTQVFNWSRKEIADPLLDLEMKLIWRNKSTRTNLIAGFISIPFLIYYIGNTEFAEGMYFIAIISTGLVLLQHGIYTISWESNYFDLLVTRFSPLEFMHKKFEFYLWASTVGLFFSSLVLFINIDHWLPILAAFCYNISWNCYTVLFGTLDNKRKLPLGESIVFKSSSLFANVLLVSFATIILPLVVYGVFTLFLSGNLAYYGVIVFSVIGFVLRQPILNVIARRMQNKKYELSTAFHD